MPTLLTPPLDSDRALVRPQGQGPHALPPAPFPLRSWERKPSQRCQARIRNHFLIRSPQNPPMAIRESPCDQLGAGYGGATPGPAQLCNWTHSLEDERKPQVALQLPSGCQNQAVVSPSMAP